MDLSDNFSEDFIRMSGLSTRFSVQGVVSACEYLGGLQEISDNKDAGYCLDVIMRMCRQLMLNAEMSDLVLSASDSAPISAEEIDAAAFLREFAEGCAGVLGEVCKFDCKGGPLTFVFANKVILRYLLLCIVRRTVIGGAVRLELECFSAENSAVIRICTAEKIQPKAMELPELGGESFRKLISGLAGRMSGRVDIGGGSFTISLPKEPEDGSLTLRSPTAELGGGVFSQYNIMLGGLGDEKYY